MISPLPLFYNSSLYFIIVPLFYNSLYFSQNKENNPCEIFSTIVENISQEKRKNKRLMFFKIQISCSLIKNILVYFVRENLWIKN